MMSPQSAHVEQSLSLEGDLLFVILASIFFLKEINCWQTSTIEHASFYLSAGAGPVCLLVPQHFFCTEDQHL
jgi:hypothetical protein